MTINDILKFINEWAPFHYAEDFDNVGLLVGNKTDEVKGILVCHDALESVVDEAIDNSQNVIVCFHPIIFSGLKSITGKNYVERSVIKAIKNDIAIVAIHTALDNAIHGVSAKLAEVLEIKNTSILLPKKHTIKKLVTYVPKTHIAEVQNALFNAGAGALGNYTECNFALEGQGTFKPNDNASPATGEKNERNKVQEKQINVIFQSHLEKVVTNALLNTHPYEQVAFEIYTTDNINQTIGMGIIGELANEMNEKDFLQHVKSTMETGGIRHSALLGKSIKKVAVLGGSGSFAIAAAREQGADAYITADLKYHDYYKAENSFLLMDIGHYESERYTKNLIAEYLTKKIANFAPALPSGIVQMSAINTNPVKYY